MRFSKERIATSALIVAGITAASYAGWLYTPAPPPGGQVPGSGTVLGAASPGAGQFFFPCIIDTTPAGAPGNPGGDQIVSVREGRDERGPYAAIEWIPSIVNQNPLITGPIATAPRLPGTATAGTTAAGMSVFCLYRPTNDPANPGWPAPPGTATASQVESAVTACHQFAEAVRAAIRFQNDLNTGVVTIPTVALPWRGVPTALPYSATIWMELNVQQGTSTLAEFYKYDICTR